MGVGTWYRIGQHALQSLARAIDEGCSTRLLVAVMERWNFPSLQQLIEYANRGPLPNCSELAETIAQCASSGDLLAIKVLEAKGMALAQAGKLVGRKFWPRKNIVV